MKRKAMLSQPMAGKTDEEIIKTRDKAVKFLEDQGQMCIRDSLYVVRECAVDEIRAGKYRVPEQKKLSTKNEEGFVKTAADPTIEVPFS